MKKIVMYVLIVVAAVGAFVGYRMYSMRQENQKTADQFQKMAEQMERGSR